MTNILHTARIFKEFQVVKFLPQEGEPLAKVDGNFVVLN